MKKLYHLILIVATAVLTSCSTSQAGLSVGNMKNTECGNTTRSGYCHTPKIKLQRDGMNIHVTLTDYLINCGHPELYMDCRQEGKRLEMNVKRKEVGEGVIMGNCACYINIYYTMYDVEGDTFQLFLDGWDKGTVSFKEHSIIYVDAYTLDQAYEEGFDYQLELFGYDFYEMNQPDIYGHGDYHIYLHFDEKQRGLFIYPQNFFLPCNANKLKVKMDVEKDGTLVFTPLADGNPCDGKRSEDCYRRANISISVVNALKDTYHIKWNPHTSVVTEADGTEHEVTTYDYEGDLSAGEIIEEDIDETVDGDDNTSVLLIQSDGGITNKGKVYKDDEHNPPHCYLGTEILFNGDTIYHMTFATNIKGSDVFDMLTIGFESKQPMSFNELKAGDTFDSSQFYALAAFTHTGTEKMLIQSLALSGKITVVDTKKVDDKSYIVLQLTDLKFPSIDNSCIFTVNGTIDYERWDNNE